MVTRPAASGTKPMIDLNSVDLPLPLTPTIAVIVPRGMAKVASRTRRVAVAVGDGDVLDGQPVAGLGWRGPRAG